eukprot:2281870-Rhodomonas_salina.1
MLSAPPISSAVLRANAQRSTTAEPSRTLMLPPSWRAELAVKVQSATARAPFRVAMAPPSCAELHSVQSDRTAETAGSDGDSTSLDSPARIAPPGPADEQPANVLASRWSRPSDVMAPPPSALEQASKTLDSTEAVAPRMTKSAPPSPPAEHARNEELRTRTAPLERRTPPCALAEQRWKLLSAMEIAA